MGTLRNVTSVGRPGWLAYWLLPRDERRTVRAIESSCRGVGDARLDGIALARLQVAVRRERLLGPLLGSLVPRPAGRLPAVVRLGRLCSTLRHPSRTGVCAGRPVSTAGTRPRTS